MKREVLNSEIILEGVITPQEFLIDFFCTGQE